MFNFFRSHILSANLSCSNAFALTINLHIYKKKHVLLFGHSYCNFRAYYYEEQCKTILYLLSLHSIPMSALEEHCSVMVRRD